MKESKQTYFNLALSFVAFALNYAINFWITPFVSANLPGTYGYVKIANDIVNYATLVTIALNSMASRFISIAYNNGNRKKAKDYYCSVMCANMFIVLILFVPFTWVVIKLNSIITVPQEYLLDIQYLFAFSFINFLLGVCFSANSVATFILNRLDLSFYLEMFTNITRAVLLFSLFIFAVPHVYYISMVGLITTTISIIGNQIIKKRCLPELKLSIKCAKVKMVLDIMFAGVWNTIQKLGQILLDGLDLLISNIFISTAAMNDLSFAKTMPGIVAALLTKVASVFMPDYTILYAQGRMKELKSNVKETMLILSVIISIPIGIIMGFGFEFYSLWIPNENIEMVTILSTLSCLIYAVSTPMNAVYNLFTVTNKVRPLALVTVLSGLVSTTCVFVLVKFTNIGIFAVVCCSVLIGFLRNICFVAPYAANMLGFKKNTFLPEIGKSVVSIVIVCTIAFVAKTIYPINGWIGLVLHCCIVGVVSLILNAVVFLSKEQRKQLASRLRRK